MGILSGNTSLNSYYHDWTRIFFKYCDGTGHQGTKSTPISYKGVDLYFRGNNLTVAQLNSVQQSHGIFNEGAEILLTGCSAGGLAAYTWANYIYSRAKGKVVAAPDSGLFLDSINFQTKNYEYRT